MCHPAVFTAMGASTATAGTLAAVSQIGLIAGGTMMSINAQKQAMIYQQQQAEFQNLLEPFITVANRECFGFNLNGFCEFQIADYNVGDFYVEHIDTNINDSESHRKLSITLQLTDPNLYDGGDFQFGCNIANPTSETLRQKGSMLLFPSFLPHSVYKVTRGKRYALVGWYEGKKWS